MIEIYKPCAIREYKPKDLEAIVRMVPNNSGYKMPQIEHPLMLIKKVIVDDEDYPRMAGFGRLHINALMFVDHTWRTPPERLELVRRLQEATFDEGRERGLDIVTTQVERRWGKRLEELGWIKGWGEIYYHDL
ncbi:MAG: hypothetical protein HRJ53_13395 [Acidobacteria bacterium Pan2503]|uniref:N-acetyltransferase domain-containing protein n=1 Tax=Candidatus Acidiferrum panamense TaxID=2741543 RepID=A0A7V8NR44_9BACT|nr:hypothetical protein [Candidatus Acidoferrum panamensis]